MGKRALGTSLLKTYIGCMIGSFLLGLAVGFGYVKGHDDMNLPILSGMALVVLGGGGGMLPHSAAVRLVLRSAAAFGAALFCVGFWS